MDNIRSAGSIKLFKAYSEVSELALCKALLLLSELQSSGVSLTDCPHNGRKNVADKIIFRYISSQHTMLALSINNPAPSTISSGDRDFAYALSIL